MGSREAARASGGSEIGVCGGAGLGPDWPDIVGMNKMNTEERLRNAYRTPSLLTDEDIAEMQRRTIAENKAWKTRKRRQENVGEVIEDKPKDQRFNSQKNRIIRRELTAEDNAKLLAAWG